MNRTSWILAFLTLVLSSCFEVIEQVNVNDDGSGSFKLTLNMSQSKSEINSARLLDSTGSISIPSIDYIKSEINRGEAMLSSTAGLSNVQVETDYENYIMTLSCDFDSLQALNNGVEFLYSQMSSMDDSYKDVFEKDENVFSRKLDNQTTRIFSKLAEKNYRMIEDAKYTRIYRFESPISSVDNQDAKVSKSGKAVMIKSPVPLILENDQIFSTSIILK